MRYVYLLVIVDKLLQVGVAQLLQYFRRGALEQCVSLRDNLLHGEAVLLGRLHQHVVHAGELAFRGEDLCAQKDHVLAHNTERRSEYALLEEGAALRPSDVQCLPLHRGSTKTADASTGRRRTP